ncbi:MAG: fibronectin type III domain-containing protein [Prevotellaceae bacterium]|jgi:hypothetical protein|nr:fibronectin type III domain-containing protein [Prevotellaceae bacterium]
MKNLTFNLFFNTAQWLRKSIFVCVCVCVCVIAQSKTYNLVTNSTQLVAGKNYILAGQVNYSSNWAFKVSITTDFNNGIYAVEYPGLGTSPSKQSPPSTLTNNTIPYGEITLEQGTNAGDWKLKFQDQYLRGSGANGMGSSPNTPENWTISIAASGAATIKCDGTNSTYSKNWLQYVYTSSGTSFKCYSSAQGEIYLYVEYIVACTSAPDAPTAASHVVASDNVTWKWNAATDATAYRYNTVNDSTIGGGAVKTANLQYQQSSLAGNTAYTLYVWAENACGISENPVTLTATTNCKTPAFTFSQSTENRVFSTGNYTRTATTSSTGTVQYSSSNESVATVDGSGVVTFISVGTTNITASLAAHGEYCSAASRTYTLNINCNSPFNNYSSGEITKTFTDGTYSRPASSIDGSFTAAGGTVSYQSSEESIATVSSAGLVTFLNTGTVTVYARTDAVSYFCAKETSYILHIVCPAPTNFIYSAITDNSATVSWTAGAAGLEYKVEYKKTGETDYTLFSESQAAVSANLSSLEAMTTYDVRITALCSETVASTVLTGTFTTCGLHSITFNDRGVENIVSQTSCTAAIEDPYYPDLPVSASCGVYEFSHWAISPDSHIAVEFPFIPEDNITLYAVYAKENGTTGATCELTQEDLFFGEGDDSYGAISIESDCGGKWTGKAVLSSNNDGMYIQINKSTSNYYIASPVFAGGVTQITIDAVKYSNGAGSNTATGRMFYICSSNTTAQPSSGDLGQGSITEANGSVTIDLTGNPTQFYIYSNGAAGIGSITVTEVVPLINYSSEPPCLSLSLTDVEITVNYEGEFQTGASQTGTFVISGENLAAAETIIVEIASSTNFFTISGNGGVNFYTEDIFEASSLPKTIIVKYSPDADAVGGEHSAVITVTYGSDIVGNKIEKTITVTGRAVSNPVGIDELLSDETVLRTEYFNISGQKLGETSNNLPHGVYIVRKYTDKNRIVVEKLIICRRY